MRERRNCRRLDRRKELIHLARRGLVCIAAIVLAAAPLASGSTLNRQPPRAPTKLQVKANGRTSLRLSWKASPDKARATGYYVYRSGRRVAALKKATAGYTFTGLRCGTSYVVGVAAHDAKGTTSKRPTVRGRTTLCLASVDNRSPTAPAALRVTATTTSGLTLAWDASNDNIGVTGYNVYVSGARVATTRTTTQALEDLACGTAYDLGVEAFDAAGNVSERTGVRATTADCPDTQAPTAPTNLRVVATGPRSISLAWDASTDNVGVAGYRAVASWTMGTMTFGATTTTTSVTISGLPCEVVYAVGVVAFDAAGNTSVLDLTHTNVFVPCPDTQAPTVPSDLRLTASSGNSLTVAWTASTDNVGVSGYRVYLGDGLAPAATTHATTATLTGLTCGTSYDIGVVAFDATTNTSGRATLTAATDACPLGRTLRVDLTSDFDFTDPSLAYFSHSWQLLYATGLKLYNYPDEPAPEGSVLQPEAAADFPTISDGGRTYTIAVKPGFRFSDGTPVTAANFAHAINRALNLRMSSPAIDFIGDIVGAQDVIDGRATTASGVHVDGDKLIVELVQPAGDFLARLSMPWFQALKTDMPIDSSGVDLPITAGPYRVTSWVKRSSATLERNPYYTGPRPANVDTIQYTIGNSPAASELRVINGETDLGAFPPADAANLANTYGVNVPGGQFHVSPQNTTWYVNLNTSRAPFDNVNLRKAVNYAVDRTWLTQQNGALAGTPTDQILPPGVPGFHDADIYPLDHPDFAKAKELAGDACSTLGRPLKLWTFNSSFGPAWAQVLQYDLKQIGCDSEILALDRVVESTEGGKKGADFDLLVNGWGQDYPDGYDFLNVLLDGNSIRDANNVNLSYFNDPIVNAKLAQAQLLTGAARDQAYGDLDVEIMRDYAPWITVLDTNARIFNSSRVTGYVYNPVYGVDLNRFAVK
jgi:ABC-type transport system substrate-binding protein